VLPWAGVYHPSGVFGTSTALLAKYRILGEEARPYLYRALPQLWVDPQTLLVRTAAVFLVRRTPDGNFRRRPAATVSVGL
jgi:hypothetical protein